MEKKFYLVNVEEPFSREEIESFIKDGKLQKASLIWEDSLPSWVRIEEYPGFSEIFVLFDAHASEQLKKVLGTDQETMERKEMKQMLSSVSEESDAIARRTKIRKIVWGITIIILLTAVAWAASSFVIAPLFSEKMVEKEQKEQEKQQSLNLEHLKFSSGVLKIEEVKGFAVKKIAPSDEKRVLAQALAEIKKDKAQEQGSMATSQQNSIFDKVSDEELNAFRKSLASGAAYESSSRGGRDIEKQMQAIPEELTSKQVAAVIKDHSRTTLEFCYNKALKLDTSLSGKLDVTLQILGNGKVANVITKSKKFKGTNMEKCVRDTIKKRWVFPQFKGSVTEVDIPFVLSSN